MSGRIEVPSGETGKLRVFALNMDAEAVRTLENPAALSTALDAADIDPAHTEIFPVKDLEGLGLAGYLVEGCGIPPEQIAPDTARLNALDGHVLLLFSRAFSGRAATLTPTPDVTHIATYSELPLDWTATPLPTDSARKRAGSATSPRVARDRARRIGGSIFAVVMVLILLILYMVVT